MVTAMYAARKVVGESRDCWAVNVDDDYLESSVALRPRDGERMVPRRIAMQPHEDPISSIFARYDPVALGTAISVILCIALLLVTTVPLLRGDAVRSPNTLLLANFLPGFHVTRAGAVLAALEGTVGGFGYGFLLAQLINGVVGWHERQLLRRIGPLRASRYISGD